MILRDAVPAAPTPDLQVLVTRLSSLSDAMGAWRLAVARRLALGSARPQPFNILAAVELDRGLEPAESALPLDAYRSLIEEGRSLLVRAGDDHPLARWLRAQGAAELRGWPLPNDRLACVFFLAAFRPGRSPAEGRLRVAEQGMEALARGLTPPQWLMNAKLGGMPGAPSPSREADRAAQPGVRKGRNVATSPRREGSSAAAAAGRLGKPAAAHAQRAADPAPAAPLVLVGTSAAVQELALRARRAAASEAHVLLCGERGTGREELARWIHAQSARAGGAFHLLPCVAFPGARLQQALLGQAVGVPPSLAEARPGLLELASAGTLYLEEVGELARDLQAALLKALREREVTRRGERICRRVDVRVIASTRHDLRELARRGRFLEELHWALAGTVVAVPALRARAEDLPALVHALARRATGQEGVFVQLDSDSLALVRRCGWAGNLRQLAAEVDRMLAQFGRQTVVRSEMLSESVRDEAQVGGVHELHQLLRLDQAYDLVEALMIRRALRSTEGNKAAAARALGLSRQGLYKKLRRHGLEARQDTERSL